MKIKVLVISTVPIRPDGITGVIFNLFHAMDKKDVVIDLLAINQPDEKYIVDIENAGGHVYQCERLKNIVKYMNYIYALVKRNEYDIVHAHGNSNMLALDLLPVKLAGCKVRIAHSHNTTCSSKMLNSLLAPVFMRLYTEGLACGDKAGKWLFGNHYFRVIKNGIDVDRFFFSKDKRKIIRDKFNIKSDEIVIGHVGLFNEQKNHKFIVDVAACLKKRNIPFKIILIGEGELLGTIKNYVGSKKMNDSFIFTGSVSNVPDYLSGIDVILMPSLYEGFPLALVEEQAAGLKCVVSNNITTEVNITGNIAFLSLDDDKEKWCDCLIDYSLYEDRLDCSCRAVKQIKESGYDITIEAEKLRGIYVNSIKT